MGSHGFGFEVVDAEADGLADPGANELINGESWAFGRGGILQGFADEDEVIDRAVDVIHDHHPQPPIATAKAKLAAKLTIGRILGDALAEGSILKEENRSVEAAVIEGDVFAGVVEIFDGLMDFSILLLADERDDRGFIVALFSKGAIAGEGAVPNAEVFEEAGPLRSHVEVGVRSCV